MTNDSVLFKKNLAAFKKSMPSFYQFIQEYTPKEFITEKTKYNYINIKNINNGNYLYQENPKKLCEEQVDVFIKDPCRIVTVADDSHNYRTPIFLHEIHIGEYQKKLELFYKKNTPHNNHRHIPCLIIIGTGLGYHITNLIQNHDILNIFIFEPNCDLFYGSLYTIDYQWILEKQNIDGKSITIQTGKDNHTFINAISERFYKNGYFPIGHLYFYKHYHSKMADDTLALLKSVSNRLFQGWGFFEDEFISINHTIKNLLTTKRVFKSEKNTYSPEIPAIIIGNGPSLDKELEFIRNNQKNFAIFSCGSSLKALYKNGIKPDFHIEIERTKSVYNWLEEIKDKEYLKCIYLLGVNNLHPKSTDLFKEFIFGLKRSDAGQLLIEKINGEIFSKLDNAGPTVVNGALAISFFLGFTENYLFGVDFGFKDPKYHHSKNSSYYENNDLQKIDEMPKNQSIKGNFCKETYTNNDLFFAKFCLEENIKLYENNKVYNCSDGAYIDGAIPKESKDIKNIKQLKHKESLLEKIIENKTIKNPVIDITQHEKEHESIIKKLKTTIDLIIKKLDSEPKNISNISILFIDIFDIIKTLRKNDQIMTILLSGTVNFCQEIIYSNTVNYHNSIHESEIIKIGIDFFKLYLSDLLSFITKNPFALHDDESLKEYQEKLHKWYKNGNL